MNNTQGEQQQNDRRLIQEVEKHTNLYDPRCKSKDSRTKQDTWDLIGIKLNTPAHICKNRWKNLRDKYTREKKLMMIEGQETYRSHAWPLLDEMSFLWNYVSHRTKPQEGRLRKSFENINYKCKSDWENESTNYEENNSLESNILDPACLLVEEPEERNIVQSRSKGDGNSDSQCEIQMGSNNLDSITFNDSYSFNLMDEEQYFCLSLAASLRRLPRKKCSLIKIRILQMLHEAQFSEG